MNKEKMNENCFHCPGKIPPWVEDKRFYIPNKDSKKIPTWRFSSPTSPLNPHKLQELIMCIEKINELLRAIGNPRDPDNLSGLRLTFRMLREVFVEVELDCMDTKEDVMGVIKDAGRDFLEIEDTEAKYYIPFIRLCSVQRNDSCHHHDDHKAQNNHLVYEEDEHQSHSYSHYDGDMQHQAEDSRHHGELSCISPRLRTDLVLNFGNVVSGNPELINIFFGIPLYLELIRFLGCRITVKTPDEEIEGALKNSCEGNLVITLKNGDERNINIDEICFVKV